MPKNPDYKMTCVDNLIPYARNSRTHSADQIAKIASSIKEFGFLNPVIIDAENGIIAGHGRVLAAQKLGLAEVPVLQASHLTEAQKRAYIIADNRLALDAGWDDEMLRLEIEELKGLNFDISLTGLDNLEFDSLFAEEKEDENTYTKKTESPTYEPTGEKPEITELFSTEKTDKLLQAIASADVPKEIKPFLQAAAHRHTVFNFEQIAEFYAHSDETLQQLMEDSALVIIDFDKAIELGYVRLSEKIAELYRADNAKRVKGDE